MRRRLGIVLGTLAVVFAASPAQAVFLYTSQTREVFAGVQTSESVVGTDDEESNSVGVFNATATVSGSGAAATTSIVSDLAPNKISMSGLFSMLSDGNHVSNGNSQLVTTFTLPTDVDYTSTLNGLATNVSQTYLLSSFGLAPFSFFNSSGILPAGDYTLSVSFHWNNSFGIGLSEQAYDFELEITPAGVPEPMSAIVFALVVIGGLAAARPWL